MVYDVTTMKSRDKVYIKKNPLLWDDYNFILYHLLSIFKL